jgi:uncharacterized protein (TIGR02186 family)
MRQVVTLAILIVMAASTTIAETIVSGLSQNRVSITADFDGSEILIYGAVKRDEPAPMDSPLNVIVTVQGPSTPLTIRRKERVAGIWINNAEVEIDRAPSFYVIATTGPLPEILTQTENLRHKISISSAIRAVGISDEASRAPDFVEALIRLRMADGTYGVKEDAVELSEDTLFRADVMLPANLTEGDYVVRLFLTRGGKVVATQDRTIGVRKEGLERFIYRMALDAPVLYGILAITIAALAGWAAAVAFRLMRW